MHKFQKILVANRGEIAVRVMRTAKQLGYSTVAVYSDADAQAPHTLMADQAVNIGEPAPNSSYLVIDKIIDAAKATGAQAIHPGYGFLSENTEFAERCAAEDIVFIGPSAEAIRLMGSKRLSKLAMLQSNVPCIPGYQGADQDDATLIKESEQVGLPLMIKASAGGGGRGMRIVHDANDIAAAIEAARAEARSAFGSDELILERAVIEPRHIEIQVFGDQHGNVVHLGERDCSIQRRHQKVVEESPSPFVSPELRERMGEAAINAAKACDYVGAGTVEFLVDAKGEFFFLEMNTRLQVEHPVTELVTGLDLVEWQLRVADGQPLPLQQKDITFNGHAVEVRLCAEDPRNDFMPQTGDIAHWRISAQAGLRVDSGITAGQVVSPFYDSMLAKVIAYGQDRDTAILSLRSGLGSMSLLGTHSNKHFLHTILGLPRFVNGEATTAFLAEEFPDGAYQDKAVPPLSIAIGAALFFQRDKSGFDYPAAGWSSAERLNYRFMLRLDGGEVAGESRQLVRLSEHKGLFCAHVGEQSSEANESAAIEFALGGTNDSPTHEDSMQSNVCTVHIDGVTQRLEYAFAADDDGVRLYLDDGAAHLVITDETYTPATTVSAGGDAQVRAAMDGAIVEVKVAVGQRVEAGEVVAVLEAMKMAHQLKAGVSGTVEEISVEPGQQVKTRQVLVSIEAGD